jgi:hypothetical protein
VWADTCDENHSWLYEDLAVDRIFRNSSNTGVYGRFAVALLARTTHVALFDDDTVPGRRYLQTCLEAMRDQPGIYSAAGVQFLTTTYRPCQRYGWAQRTDCITEVDVGCQSWLLQRQWLGHLWRESPFDWRNGEDMRLSYLCQKYGGVRTYVPAQTSDETSGSRYGNELGSGPEALSAGPGHYRLRTLQLQEQLRNGWLTVREVRPGPPRP